MITNILVTGILIGILLTPTAIMDLEPKLMSKTYVNGTVFDGAMNVGIKGFIYLSFKVAQFGNYLVQTLGLPLTVVLFISIMILSRFGIGMVKGSIAVILVWKNKGKFFRWLKRREKENG